MPSRFAELARRMTPEPSKSVAPLETDLEKLYQIDVRQAEDEYPSEYRTEDDRARYTIIDRLQENTDQSLKKLRRERIKQIFIASTLAIPAIAFLGAALIFAPEALKDAVNNPIPPFDINLNIAQINTLGEIGVDTYSFGFGGIFALWCSKRFGQARKSIRDVRWYKKVMNNEPLVK